LESQVRRFVDGGFAADPDPTGSAAEGGGGGGGGGGDGGSGGVSASVVSETMLTMYDRYIGPDEHKRVAKLEIFDELEEWRLLMAHYCFTVAVRGSLLRPLLPRTPAST
jgi:hypothetical protein